MSDTGRIAVAIIRKAHGVRGEASVELWSDDPGRLDELDAVTLVSPDEKSTHETRIEAVREHSGRFLVKFSGIESPEALASFRNWTIEVPESEARELGEDEYFLHDLPGLTLVDGEGRTRGVVREAYEGGGGILLEVQRADGRKFDVPFAADICLEIDLGKKTMLVELPDGIEDLQAIPAIEEERERAASHAHPIEIEDASAADAAAASTQHSALSTQDSGLSTQDSRLRIDFVTIFPKMFEPLVAEGVIARGIKQGILDIRVWDLRDYATDKHRSTDDEAYGGGPGMVMLGEPVFRCIEAIRATAPEAEAHLVMTTPQGRAFRQPVAKELAGRRWLVFLCGRYEGFDQRVHDALAPDEISIGDFVVSGGELPAMLIADAVSRMIPGVVGNTGSVEEDSFFNGLLDYPHYTRPEELRGARIPEILLSGHHEKIRKWRKLQSLQRTLEKRPDLLDTADLDAEARKMLASLRDEAGNENRIQNSEKKR